MVSKKAFLKKWQEASDVERLYLLLCGQFMWVQYVCIPQNGARCLF